MGAEVTGGSGKPSRTRARRRAQLRHSRIPVFENADLSTRRLALIEARSGRPGPHVWLTACIHGDEVGGIVVVQEVFRRLRAEPLMCGRLSAFPLLNPLGFEATLRHIPSTQEDLNRAFPGAPDGTVAERIADLVYSRITATSPALVLDLHNDWIRSIPYALIDPRPAGEPGRDAHASVRAAAAYTGLPLVDEQEDGVSRAMLRSTLSGSLLEAGVPALTLELGAAQVVDERNVVSGVAAIWRVLQALGLAPGEPLPPAEAPAEKFWRGRMLRYNHRPFPSRGGIARFRVAPGEIVRAGGVLSVIEDVFGRRVETLRAERDALVLGHADSSLAVPGVPLVALAERKKTAPRPRVE